MFGDLLKGKIQLKRSLLIVMISYATFIFSFVPYLYSPESVQGIVNNVLKYKSIPGNSISDLFLEMLNPFLFGYVISSRLIFVASMILLGIIIARIRNVTYLQLLLLYFVSLVACSSGVADQYLVIPLVSLIYFGGKWSIPYIVLATIILLISPNNVGRHIFPQNMFDLLLQVRHSLYYLAQMLLLIFVFAHYKVISKNNKSD